MQNLRYPAQAQQEAIVGTSLVSLTVAPTGKLANVSILTSLGKAVDWEVKRVVQATEKLWLPAYQQPGPDSIMLILPVTFLLGDKNFCVEEVKPDFILSKNEIVVVGYGQSIAVKDDEYYTTHLITALEEKNYKQGLNYVSELIRRNPYSEKLYFQRAIIEKQLGQTDEACRDYKIIMNLLGKKHLPKQFLLNCP
ncbi:MAG: TonB [Spirosoma sp.]|nr:TonB [Spirosoma sp.]